MYYLPGRSAEDFRKWAIDNPLSLCQHLKLKIIPKNSQVNLSEGFIFIYKKNRCGLHPRFGHIEIISKLSPLIACSDHCRYLNKKCKPDLILAPVKKCSPLHEQEKINCFSDDSSSKKI